MKKRIAKKSLRVRSLKTLMLAVSSLFGVHQTNSIAKGFAVEAHRGIASIIPESLFDEPESAGDLEHAGKKFATKKYKYVMPAEGELSSGYGWRWGRMHDGIDIANYIGTKILAAADGEVIFAGWSGGYGYLIEIRHEDGAKTLYAHNSQILVSVGQNVKQSQIIALMGSTGHTTGPHLHFEIINPSGVTLDPENLLNKA